MKKQVVMVIMDGYGLTGASAYNAIENANTPVLDELFRKCPNSKLAASGEDVGLPHGQMGNSEVGHTNIGAGRVVYQDLPMISLEIENGNFFNNVALLKAIDACHKNNSALHLIGLVSPGGVHSHINHLFGLLELAKKNGLQNVYIHCFMDGRDVPPDSGKDSIALLIEKSEQLGVGKIATIMGRFYAMDRDNRWDRVEKAYNAMVLGEGVQNTDPISAMLSSYEKAEYDEFIDPIVCDKNGLISANDSVVFFNFRPDRAREITRAFTDSDFDGFDRREGFFPLTFVCMTQYDETFKNVLVAYPPSFPSETFGEVISRAGLKQLRIAETEKYAHVTFFFNGGVEAPFEGESRILIPSPKEFATYDKIPEMSAFKVAESVCEEIISEKFDVVIVNFANCDMVGHTGIYEAAVRAVETVDTCLGMVKKAVEEACAVLIITADHGNAEEMVDSMGGRQTAHTTNPVPFIIYDAGSGGNRNKITLQDGRLADISPTILDIIKVSKPSAMTGESLIK